MTIEYPSSYQDEYDALRQMIALSGRADADIAVHLFPKMKRRSARIRLLNCLNPHRRNVLTFGKIIEAMRFCGRFDPLMHAFDEMQKQRPSRLTTEMNDVFVRGTLESAALSLNTALHALSELQALSSDCIQEPGGARG